MKLPWRTSDTAPAVLKAGYRDANIHELLTARLGELLDKVPASRPIIVMCIGTDRSTGDSLGPLIGTLLGKSDITGYKLYGTLEQPVHAMNLQQTLTDVQAAYTNPYIIAVDACLGQQTSVGTIQIGTGPMKPGAGVNKQLPAVGDLHITGIVNVGGFMEYLVLQNTRLSLVMDMAEVIAASIQRCFLFKRGSLPYSALS